MPSEPKLPLDIIIWLKDKPADWPGAISGRAAMRAIPYLNRAREQWLRKYFILAMRMAVIIWTAQKYRDFDLEKVWSDIYWSELVDAAMKSRADKDTAYNLAIFSGELALAANFDDHQFEHGINRGTPLHAQDACDMAARSAELATKNEMAASSNLERFRLQEHADANWMEKRGQALSIARPMARLKLWSLSAPDDWSRNWHSLFTKLLAIDPNYSIWIDWYQRRIDGIESAFDIPGDNKSIEEKNILRQLTQDADEDFWGKGHEYVNATLKGWIDEAKVRVAPLKLDTIVEMPPQEAGATGYGLNSYGRIDQLPAKDQKHLRDVPDQRRAYSDLREAALELLREGQRLGELLQKAMDRLIASLPERFEDAEAYLVWRDGNALRRLHFAHQKVHGFSEPHPDRLEAGIGVRLGGVLDLFNNFAFDDDGLRQKDERRIAPQERADAVVEAAAALPLVRAALQMPEIATERALGDLKAEADDAALPQDDPYAAQGLDQSNRVKRNWFAALFTGVRKSFESPELVGRRFAKGVTEGVGKAVGAAAVGSVIGAATATALYPAPILQFVSAHAVILSEYAAIAFPGFPHLPELIAQSKHLWDRLTNE